MVQNAKSGFLWRVVLGFCCTFVAGLVCYLVEKVCILSEFIALLFC